MSRFCNSVVDIFGHCCGSSRSGHSKKDSLSYHCDSTDFDDGPCNNIIMTAKARRPVSSSTDPINNNHHTVKGSLQQHLHRYPMLQQEQLQRSAASAFPSFGFLPSNKNCDLDAQVIPPPRPPPPKAVVAAVPPQNVSVIKVKSGNLVTEIQDKLFDGLMKIFSETLESLVFVVCPVGKARRKEKDTGSGPSSGVGAGNDEGKLYLESALLERHLNETDLIRLVGMPTGLEKNEWMASHTIALFEHVNLIYGTISEFCTPTSCPDMTGPCMRTYLWFDERGKKVKVAAPQYIDYVMTFIQKTINDESLFPTKSTNAFPSSFQDIVKKICRLMFHVIAHIYHCHFKEIVLLSMHAHLNCVFAHFMTFNELFKLVEEKETEILQDLSLAMKLRSDLSDDDPMSDSNKENIIVTKSSSSFQPDSSDPSATTMTSASASVFNPSSSDDSLLIKEPALVNAVSDSQ